MTANPLQSVWRFLQSPALLFYVLIYFMALLVTGTLAQKYIGLFAATHLFFNSFIYWVGPVPVPAGASVLSVLFLNLLIHFITTSKWDRASIGTTIAHLSILVLLAGGGITLFQKQEGFMLLQAHQPAGRVYDYHKRELVLYQGNKEILVVPATTLATGKSIALPAHVPFHMTVETLCRHCSLDNNDTLVEQPLNKDDEINQWGAALHITGKNGTPIAQPAVTEFSSPVSIPAQTGKHDYYVAMRRHSWTLPFSLVLNNFTQKFYDGTAIARHYESALDVVEQHGEVSSSSWPALISMNDPLRYKGYTFYQSSVLNLPDGDVASVLNVVDNAGWLFPYIATFLLCAGLLLHLGMRRHAPR